MRARKRETKTKPKKKRNKSVSPYSLGIALSGGGSFGAWEIGALLALWDVWAMKHPGEIPPIKVVAGTSTGAVIAPFALLTRAHLEQVDNWYQQVGNDDIFGLRPSVLLIPAVGFFLIESSILDFGYPGPSNPHRYYQNYKTSLKEHSLDTLGKCAAAWPGKRLAIASVDFGSGELDVVRNWPQDISVGNPSGDPYSSRLYDGIVASAMTPLIGPPISLLPGGVTTGKTVHFDGGVCSEIPFGALFDVAAETPAISLTHVIAISSFPFFPGIDASGPAFPTKPNFLKVGLRFDTLLSEGNATKDIRLARAALALLQQGVSSATVADVTGLSINGPPPVLIEAVPSARLGWDNGQFLQPDMQTWRDAGYNEGLSIFGATLP